MSFNTQASGPDFHAYPCKTNQRWEEWIENHKNSLMSANAIHLAHRNGKVLKWKGKNDKIITSQE